jgi:hypothetical protein
VVGNALKVAPEQIGPTPAKVGRTGEFTTTVIVVVFAHCPTAGVNVYVVVAVLLTAGLHVPGIEFVDIVGKAVKVDPEQIGET